MKKTCAPSFDPHNSKVSKLSDEADNAGSTVWPDSEPELVDSAASQDAYVSVCDESGVAVNYPAVWSEQQWLERREKHKWLSARDGNLGCSDCAAVSSLGLIKTEGSTNVISEWASFKVTLNGSNKIQQLNSLRSKISLHQSSTAHRKAHLTLSKVQKSRSDEGLKLYSYKSTNQNTTYHLVGEDEAAMEGDTNSDTDDDVSDVDSDVDNNNSDVDRSSGDFPAVWSKRQWLDRKKKHKWLIAKRGFLGCGVCSSVKGRRSHHGLSLSVEWIKCKVSCNGVDKRQQLKSLRSKISLHQSSFAHRKAQIISTKAKKPVNVKNHQSGMNQTYRLVNNVDPFSNSDVHVNDADTDVPALLQPQVISFGTNDEVTLTPLDTVPAASPLKEADDVSVSGQIDGWYPEVWSEQQWQERKTKHKWLSAHNGYLGCTDCASASSNGLRKLYKGLLLSPEWVNFTVSFNGSTKVQQLRSLRTKIFGHQTSLAHKRVQSIIAEAVKGSDVSCKSAEVCLVKTENDEPSPNSETLIDTQLKNSCDSDLDVVPVLETQDDSDENICEASNGEFTNDDMSLDTNSVPTAFQPLEDQKLTETEGRGRWYPAVWTELQWLERRAKHKWLSAKNGYLGCSDCASISSLGRQNTQGLILSPEWVNFTVSFNGSTKVQQLRSLRTKISGHQLSLAHKRVQSILAEAEKLAEDCKDAQTCLIKTENILNGVDEPFSTSEALTETQTNEFDTVPPVIEPYDDEDVCDETYDGVTHVSTVSQSQEADNLLANNGNDSWYPAVWSEFQWLERRTKHKWLSAKNGYLGCNFCALASTLGRKKTQGLLLSPEWVNFTVTFNGSTKVQQLRSLRTKISGHQSSLAHQRVQTMLTEAEKGSEGLETKYQPAYLEKMEKLFNTAYYIAKNDRPFSDHGDLIKLQIKNGIDVTIPLHECYSAIEIVNHIASEFRKRLTAKLMTEDKKISVVLDESTTLGEITVLIVYLKTFLGETEDLIFLDLVSLDDHKADTVATAILKCLKSHGLTAAYLQKNFVCLVCDSTSLILGKTSSVGNLLKVKLKQPQMMIWYRSNAQLESAVHVIISEINNIDISKHKSRVLLKNASSLMFIKLNGPPLATWNATPYVMSWLMDHQASEEVNILHLNSNDRSVVDKQNIWKLF